MTNKKTTDEEVSIDLSKVTNLFKRKKKKAKTETEESQDEVSLKDINWKEVGGFFKVYGWVFLLLIAMFVAGVFRMYPATLPMTDVWAEDSVNNYFRSQIESQISQQYPNLPAANRQALVDAEFEKLLDADNGQLQQQIDLTSEQFKQRFKDETGQTYLLAIDPYHWLRHAENYVDHGYVGDVMVDGQQRDNHMLAPIGTNTGNSFHVVLGATAYKIVHAVDDKVSLLNVMFFLPLIFSVLSIIPCFLLTRKLAGTWGAFFASLVLSVHPNFMTRTIAGFSDTDAYNVFFPLLIFWLFFEAIDAQDTKKGYIFGGLAGLAVAIYAKAWQGWWYVFDFIIAAIAIYAIYLLLINRTQLSKKHLQKLWDDKLKQFVYPAGTFIGSSLVFILIFSGVSKALSFITSPLRYLSLNVAAAPNLWPNVLTTVAELNDATLKQIIGSMGGTLLFLIAFIGVLFMLFKKDIKKNKVLFAILLTVWVLGTIFMALKGVRFTLLIVPAFAVAFGVGAGSLIKTIVDWMEKMLSVHKTITMVVFIILFMIVVGFSPLPPFCTHGLCAAGQSTAMNEIPSYTDAWHSSLTKIKENSQEDAIINSWWDFGHWFKWGADRAVTFDGASQKGELAHLIGHSLLTDNERKTVGILRLLDCGGTYATDKITEITGDVEKGAKIIHEIVLLDRPEAKSYLTAKGWSSQDVEDTLDLTHCENPPEDFYITSEDMVGKAGVWGHFGSWNFERAKIWRDARSMTVGQAISFMVSEFNYTEDKARNTYYDIQSMTTEQEANAWISPWPGYVSTGGCSELSEEELSCKNNVGGQILDFRVDLENKTAHIINAPDKPRAKSLVLVEDGDLVEYKFKENTIPYSLDIIPNGNGGYSSLVVDPLLAKSTFTRLFYYKGLGSEYFEQFDYQRSVTGVQIYVWKVDWSGKVLENKQFETLPEEPVEAEEEVAEDIVEEDEQGLDNQSEE